VNPISHNLASLTQRIAKLRDGLEEETSQIAELWRDEVGRTFLRQQVSEVTPQINQLVSELSVAIEEFESIAKQLRDPQMS
jgi:hypothetical protein